MTTDEDLSTGTDRKSENIHLVACLVTDKKYRKMGGEEGLKSALQKRHKNVQIGQIQVEELLNGPGSLDESFRNILKKQFGLPETGDEVCVTLIHKYSDFFRIPGLCPLRVLELRDWLKGLRNCRVLDDPENIDVLANRVRTGNLIREMCVEEGFEGNGLQWPEFHVGSMQNLSLPVIIKPVDACSTDESHWMTLLNRLEDSDSECPALLNENVLVQKFHEHFGVLYKVYVIGDSIEIVARPSIRAGSDFGKGSFRFNTHKFKAVSGDLDSVEAEAARLRLEPLRDLIVQFAWRLKSRLNLTWFGIDVLIPESPNELRAAVIDVNYMPGFDGVTGLTDKLIKTILDC